MDLINIAFVWFSACSRTFLLTQNISVNNKTDKYHTVVSGEQWTYLPVKFIKRDSW